MNNTEEQLNKSLLRDGYRIFRNGWPDFLASANGQIIAIEVKPTNGEPLRPNQLEVMEILESLGVKCYKWSPSDGFYDYKYKLEKPAPLEVAEMKYKKSMTLSQRRERDEAIKDTAARRPDLTLQELADIFHLKSRAHVFWIIKKANSKK